jgi:predicted ArsR family transcriptional regulator
MSNIRQVILEMLSQRGPLPLDALARATHRSPMALRYHLALLMDEDLVAAKESAHRGVVGRPEMLYTLADNAHERLPKHYHRLAERLLDEIGATLGEKGRRALLRRAGRKEAAPAPVLRRGASIAARMKRAASFLCARGYMARWEKSDGAFALHVCNCPYRQVARAHPEICEMDAALIAALLDVPAKMTGCIANQDSACSFVTPSRKGLHKIDNRGHQ